MFERFYAKVHLSNPKTVNGLVKLLESKGDKLKIRDVPANPQERLSKVDSPDQDQVNDPEVRAMRQLYQMVVGSLIWVQTTGRFDINAALLHLCRFMSNPGEKHTQAMIWTVGYLKGSSKMKHFEIELYWIQDEVQVYKTVKLVKIDTKYQLADPGTKNLPYKEFKEKVMQFMTDFIQVVVDYFQWGK